jgi:hypothetical protein
MSFEYWRPLLLRSFTSCGATSTGYEIHYDECSRKRAHASNWDLIWFGNFLAYIVVVAVNSVAGAIGTNGLQTARALVYFTSLF